MSGQHGSTSRVRGAYVHPSWYWAADVVEGSRDAMCEWLDVAAEANVNLLYAWTETPWIAASLGERRYADEYPFWDPDRWDALGELVEEAGARGMEVHVTYSFTRYKRDREWVPEYDPDLEVLPPGDPDWASVRRAEYEEGHVDPADPGVEGSALCINELDAHAWTIDVLARLFDRYPGLGGLHVEEPGYLELDRCVCYRCRAAYRMLTGEPGENLVEHVHDSLDAYRDDDAAVPVKTRGTDAFVRRLFVWWDRHHPEKPLSFNGHWDPNWDLVRGRNWASWAAEGMVPYFCPQIYTDDADEFRECVETNVAALADAETTVLPIAAASWSGGSNDPRAVVQQLETALGVDEPDAAIGGTNIFSGRSLTPELARALGDGPWSTRSGLPWSRPVD